MEDYTLIQLPVPKELNFALNTHLNLLRHGGAKITKAELIIKLMRKSLVRESAKLIQEGRVDL